MRGEFNDTLAVRYGVRSHVGTPGDVWATDVPCRVVPQREIDQHQFPFGHSASWVTLDSLELHGPYTVTPWLGAVWSDYLSADVVEFTSQPGVLYIVCREEVVEPFGRVPYVRYLLIPLLDVAPPTWPPPDPLPPGPWSKIPASCNGSDFTLLMPQRFWIHFGRSPAPLCTDDFAVLNGETVGPLVWDVLGWNGEPQLGFDTLQMLANWVDAGRPVVNTVGLTLGGAVNDTTGLSSSSCMSFRLVNTQTATGDLGSGIVSYVVDEYPD